MRNEDGHNAGARNFGRLALWTIPLSLGVAALVWLGFIMSAHGWLSGLSQEDRRAVYVGAAERPKGKLRIETPDRGSSARIIRVDVDGATAAVYVINTGYGNKAFTQVHWQLVSPDGTLLKSGSEYLSLIGGPEVLRPGEKAEGVFSGYRSIAVDDRAIAISFWTE